MLKGNLVHLTMQSKYRQDIQQRYVSIILWNMACAEDTPNRSLVNSKRPLKVFIVVSLLDFGSSNTC